MTGRQLAAIAAVALALLATWLLVRGAERDGGAADGLDLGAAIGADIRRLSVERPGDEGLLELERESGGWTVNAYPADDSLVEGTLAVLATLSPGRLVARSSSNHARLGLDEGSATRIRVGPASAPAADFLVGGAGTDGRFVRLPGADEAYVFSASALDPLVRPESAWRDYTIARVDTAALRRIVIRRRGQAAAVLERQPDGTSAGDAAGWSIDGAAADTSVVRVYLNVLDDLEATGFPADTFVFAADFENPVAAVDLFMDGTEAEKDAGIVPVPDVSLLFSSGLDHPDVLVRRADFPIVYALDRMRANVLTTSGERFRRR